MVVEVSVAPCLAAKVLQGYIRVSLMQNGSNGYINDLHRTGRIDIKRR